MRSEQSNTGNILLPVSQTVTGTGIGTHFLHLPVKQNEKKT